MIVFFEGHDRLDNTPQLQKFPMPLTGQQPMDNAPERAHASAKLGGAPAFPACVPTTVMSAVVSMLVGLPTAGQAADAVQTSAGVTGSTEAPSPNRHVTRRGDNLWRLGIQFQTPKSALSRWMVATLRKNPDAFINGNIHRLRTGVPLQLPRPDEVRAEAVSCSAALVQQHLDGIGTRTRFAQLSGLNPAAAAPALPPRASEASAASDARPQTVLTAASSPTSRTASNEPKSSDTLVAAAVPGGRASTEAPVAQTPATEPGLKRFGWWLSGLALVALAAGWWGLWRLTDRRSRSGTEAVGAPLLPKATHADTNAPTARVPVAASEPVLPPTPSAATRRLVDVTHASQTPLERTEPVGQHARDKDRQILLKMAKAQIELGRTRKAIPVLQRLASALENSLERAAAQSLLAELNSKPNISHA